MIRWAARIGVLRTTNDILLIGISLPALNEPLVPWADVQVSVALGAAELSIATTSLCHQLEASLLRSGDMCPKSCDL